MRSDIRILLGSAAIAAAASSVYAPLAAGDGSGLRRPTRTITAAIVASASFTEFSPYLPISSRMQTPGAGQIGSLLQISLAFHVTVCLDDDEYSIACRERSLLEAARRLEQLFVDDYTAGRAAGTLEVKFPLAVGRQEQLQFLREAEDRAIAAAANKLQNQLAPAQQLHAWYEAATMEARSGRNWQHDWSAGTHRYQLGPALYQLAQIKRP